MPMYNPPHPGKGLRDDFDALGLSIAKAANALGVTRQQLYKVVNGTSAISPEMAIRLEAVIGSTADQWLRMQNAYDLAQIRNGGAGIADGLERLRVA
ncbi:MAG: addiction module antidote protein, HigA family [Robiginitomaculum sp.]|nr:MAG: addiction module antidote protein, HigA family [Robiginitomaculum sp.]